VLPSGDFADEVAGAVLFLLPAMRLPWRVSRWASMAARRRY